MKEAINKSRMTNDRYHKGMLQNRLEVSLYQHFKHVQIKQEHKHIGIYMRIRAMYINTIRTDL